jgi:cyclic dehypoxanthinyl futalosine synthase
VKLIEQPANADEAWIVDTVRKLADKAGIGMPEVGIFEGDPNAFATGAFRDSALVAVSTGLLQNMTHEEIEAVLAHEVAHIAKLEKMTHHEVLSALQEAGMDSLPGAGAEILVDRVRRLVSNGKCGAQEWLDVMAAAHQLNITSSATMMFGHVETLEERFEHLIKIREVQSRKPESANGFLAFIPWTFQDVDTLLMKIRGVQNLTTGEEYIRMIAISRIMLPNIKNIQASWLTVGKKIAQICLHAGANDFGSIMLEENVVSAAGAPHRFTYKSMQDAIREAGFEPQLRNQEYQWRELPAQIEEQVINY